MASYSYEVARPKASERDATTAAAGVGRRGDLTAPAGYSNRGRTPEPVGDVHGQAIGTRAGHNEMTTDAATRVSRPPAVLAVPATRAGIAAC